jgi:hypothetical protein
VAVLQGVAYSIEYDTGAAFSADVVGFDDREIMRRDKFTIEMLPGAHDVLIDAKWSNDFVDNSKINFIADAGKKYQIGIYELKPGQDPATADFHKRSFAYTFGVAAAGGAAVGALQGLAPLIIMFGWPLLLYAALRKTPEPPPPPRSRPFKGCCFVWIQDQETAAVVAGAAPQGQVN